MNNVIDVRTEIEEATIGRFHWKLGILVGIIMFFDGYDLFNAAYVIPLILKSWKPSPSEIGMMLSSGIVGMSVGSLLQGLIADRIGRRKTMVWALYLLTASSIALALLAASPLQFAGLRLVLGTALGMVTPLTIAYVNEWAPKKAANTYTIWVFLIGFCIGGVAAGVAGITLTATYGWESLYYVGALSIVVALAAHAWLPESPQFLALKGQDAAIREILAKLRPEKKDVYQSARISAPKTHATRGSFLSLFSKHYIRDTAIVWSSGFLSLFCIHALTGWLPTIMVQRGEAVSSAFTYGMLIMMASLVGGLVSGWFADYVKSRVSAMVIWYLLAAVAMLGLGFSQEKSLTVTLVLASGFFIFGAQSVLNNHIAMVYDTEIRSTGVGVAVGVNRVGGMLGPVIIGTLKAIDPNPLYTFYVLAGSLVLAAACFAFARSGKKGGLTGSLAEESAVPRSAH